MAVCSPNSSLERRSECLEEPDLQHRLPAADGEPAVGGRDKPRVLRNLVDHPPHRDAPALRERPHVGVLAVLAAQRAPADRNSVKRTPGPLTAPVIS